MLKISVKGIGDTEHYRKRQNSIGGSLIAKAALGSSAVEKGIRVVQQGLHGRGRRNPGGAGLEGEHTLLVRQCDEGNGQPVTLGQSLRRVAGIRRRDPSLIGFDDLLDRGRRQRVGFRQMAHRIADLGV